MLNDVLVIELETSGLPPKGIPLGDPQYPWIIEASAEVFSLDAMTLGIFSRRVIADGRHIHPGATAVHGISTKDAGREGASELVALGSICNFAQDVGFITGYGIEFDRDVIHSALILLGKNTARFTRRGLQMVDLMKPATAVCKIPGDHYTGGYRWPTFETAVETILGEKIVYGGPRSLRTLLKAQAAKRLFLHFYNNKMLDLEMVA